MSDVENSLLPRVCIVGMGYVGLATVVCLASRGYRVRGVEIDAQKCAMIQEGKSPIHEHGIDSGLEACIADGSFTCSYNVREAVSNSDITFLTVGTPSKPSGEIDLSFIKSAAFEVGHALKDLKGYHLVVVKSTVTPGSTQGTIKKILEEASEKKVPEEVGLCFNPEFLREGSAVYDTLHADAVIIGSQDERSRNTLLSLYEGFYGKDNLPYALFTNITNAEFVKYSINTFRATQLSFLNSLANLCEKIPSADIAEVTKGLSAVTKIDNRYLKAGLGYGGSCLPKDTRALTFLYQNAGIDAGLLESAAAINRKQPLRALETARQILGDLKGRKIAVLGLAFKAGTDDIRESVAISLVKALLVNDARVSVHDPQAMHNAQRELGSGVDYASNPISCIKDADCCVVATEWDEYRGITPSTFKREMKLPFVIDGRRIYEATPFEQENVRLHQIGRNSEIDAPLAELKATIRNVDA